jgi:hypothetical protein
MKDTKIRKEFIGAVGRRLRRAFKESDFRSYRELTREAGIHGHKFSSELLTRYFQGAIEPGIFAFCGILNALNISADSVLFGRELTIRDPKRLDEGDLRSAVQMAIIAENFGYPVRADDIEDFLKGRTEPGIFEFAGMLEVLRESADSILFGKPAKAPTGVLTRGTADKLVNLLQKTGPIDPEYDELIKLYSEAPVKVQKAVLELLRSAGLTAKKAQPRKTKK